MCGNCNYNSNWSLGGDNVPPPTNPEWEGQWGQENSIYPTFPIHKSGFSVHV